MSKIVELKIEQIKDVVGGVLALTASTSALKPVGMSATIAQPTATQTSYSQPTVKLI